MNAPSHTQTWREVREFYERLVETHDWPFVEMLRLVEYLETSAYANALFPFTSHEVLHIGRVPDFARGDNSLEIHFNTNNKAFTFTYWQHAGEQQPWSVACEESEWKYTLERVLHKRLRWFHEG